MSDRLSSSAVAERDVNASAPKVFIGSSSEAIERGIVPRLESLLGKSGYRVNCWDDCDGFAPGEFTLDALLQIAGDTDLALFVFSKDDTATVRGRTEHIPRDNVLLEYGLFTAFLGRRRVAVVHEEGVKLPVDVNGMGVARFSSSDDPRRNATLELAVAELARRWNELDLPPRVGRFADAGLGFRQTVPGCQQRLDEIAGRLWKYDRLKQPADDPVGFDSSHSCVSTYAEALDLVKNRFWTTTYLSSGFWAKKQATVLNANKKMLERLAKTGQARRLFPLQQPPSVEIEAWREHHMLDRKLSRASRIEERNLQVGYLKSNVAELKRAGCDVRVIYDSQHVFKTLPDEMEFRPHDSEIAIYDRFRVDVFQGGSAGAITAVTCYTPAVAQFDAYLAQSDAYFSTLWDGANDMGEFIAKLESAIGSAEARIDYESNWLAFYEFGLSQEDIGLKTVESKRVEEVLRREDRWGHLRRCLDIGTCTGRYPMLLAAALDSNGTIKGVDDDFDCVRFAKSNVQRHCPGETRIRIDKEDFTAPDTSLTGKFDLITCMLGTLSHFGRERKPAAADGFNDGLQRALARMRSLLADDGLLLLGTWSEHACAGKNLLGIYRDADIDRLVAWTPTLRELRQRIGQAGLSIVEEAHPDVRLDLTVCRHSDGESRNGARS